MMRMINEFITLNKNACRGDTYYINYPNLCLWLEDWFPEYNFVVNTDITDNTVAVNISKIRDADIKKEVHVACAKIPIEAMIDNDTDRIKQVVQNAIYRR